MKETFLFLQKKSFGVWLDPKNTTLIHAGPLSDLPAGAELIAISPTEAGAQLATRYYASVNPSVRAATA